MPEAEDLVIGRVNKGLCPVCNKPLGDKDIIFVAYNDSKQPIHKSHVKYKGCDTCMFPSRGVCYNRYGVEGAAEISSDSLCENYKKKEVIK